MVIVHFFQNLIVNGVHSMQIAEVDINGMEFALIREEMKTGKK